MVLEFSTISSEGNRWKWELLKFNLIVTARARIGFCLCRSGKTCASVSRVSPTNYIILYGRRRTWRLIILFIVDGKTRDGRNIDDSRPLRVRDSRNVGEKIPNSPTHKHTDNCIFFGLVSNQKSKRKLDKYYYTNVYAHAYRRRVTRFHEKSHFLSCETISARINMLNDRVKTWIFASVWKHTVDDGYGMFPEIHVGWSEISVAWQQI